MLGRGGTGGLEACFFVFEGAELLSEGDPFIQIMGEGMGGIFGVEANLVGDGADVGGESSGELCGLTGFGAIGLLGGG